MDLEFFVVLFFIIFFAVRLAINPLINKPKKTITENQNIGLVDLRDIGILSNQELEEVIRFYNYRNVKEENYDKYHKYAKVLHQLRELNYFSEKEYSIKLDYLKKYFNFD